MTAPAPPPCLTAEALGGVPHGFFGRRGGVSTGELASLNTGPGSGDDPAAVIENRRRVADALIPGARRVTGVYQVHGADCVTLETPWLDEDRPHADAIVTNRPGLLIGVLTADCVPVLLADRDAGVVGAAHAGWKGALAGVTDRTIDAMVALGAGRSRIVAAIGPCIGRASYEVHTAFAERFVAAEAANADFFGAAARHGHAMFDIAAYVARRLAQAGVRQVEMSDHDTYARVDDYFSYRRSCHRGEGGYGRQLSVIGVGA